MQSGDEFLFGERLGQGWPTEIFLSKWKRRYEQEPDDCLAAPATWAGDYAWEGVEGNRIPWAALKSV